ncbi:MAG: hypothetical protein PSV18_07935 [Methylobacter sp.]|nr:hypothetical protein [Candidatus Methylobacter titanis]
MTNLTPNSKENVFDSPEQEAEINKSRQKAIAEIRASRRPEDFLVKDFLNTSITYLLKEELSKDGNIKYCQLYTWLNRLNAEEARINLLPVVKYNEESKKLDSLFEKKMRIEWFIDGCKGTFEEWCKTNGKQTGKANQCDTTEQASGKNGAGSQAVTEPASTKPMQTNGNDFEFSGLLNIPAKIDDWFTVIDDMTRTFHKDNERVPNEPQAWAQLWTSPPSGYGITIRGVCLGMPGVNPLSRGAFKKRWKSYTTKKTPISPDNGF